jgi:transposase
MGITTVGIDVAAATFTVSVRRARGEIFDKEYENNPAGHAALISRLVKIGSPVQVGLEWTGNYGFDLAVALSGNDSISVMMINPREARSFHDATKRRAKTDKVDAESLREYVERMDFVTWQCPDSDVLKLRAVTRRIDDITVARTREKNRLHAALATNSTPKVVIDSIEQTIAELDEHIDILKDAALKLVMENPEHAKKLKAMCTIKGVAERTAVALLSEFLVLPPDMSGSEVAAHAGLDPKTTLSGTSVHGSSSISKRGNGHIRGPLFMPAQAAVRFQPSIREFYERLIAHGKRAKVALVACMRRLLVVLWTIARTGEAFDDAKFRPRAGRSA